MGAAWGGCRCRFGVVRARSYMEAGAPSDTVQGTDVIPSEEPALGSTHVDMGLPESISTLPDLISQLVAPTKPPPIPSTPPKVPDLA